MKVSIGEKIAMLRKERQITQTQLAEYLFLVPQTISKWEVGSGTPEITLLPKIAAFFGISIDELFGVSDLNRVEDLVCRYSVLRDEQSFQEAMDCLRSRLQNIEALRRNGTGDGLELDREEDRLKALELHLLLQQSRESAQRALKITEMMLDRTGEMPYRLQRLQLLAMLGEGRSALKECQEEFWDRPCLDALQAYFEMLANLGRDEGMLEAMESDDSVKELLHPPSRENARIWLQCILAAVRTGNLAFVEEHGGAIERYGDQEARACLLQGLTVLYRETGQEEKYAAAKEQLLSALEGLPMNPYIAEDARRRMEAL